MANITASIVLLVLTAIVQCYSFFFTPVIIFIIGMIYTIGFGVFGIVGLALKNPLFIFITMIGSIASEILALVGFGFLIAITVDLSGWNECSYGICGSYGLFIFLTILSAASIPLYLGMIWAMVKLRKALLATPPPPPVIPLSPVGAQSGLVYVQGPNGQYIPTYINPAGPQQVVGQPVPGTVFIAPPVQPQQVAFVTQPVQPQPQQVFLAPIGSPQPQVTPVPVAPPPRPVVPQSVAIIPVQTQVVRSENVYPDMSEEPSTSNQQSYDDVETGSLPPIYSIVPAEESNKLPSTYSTVPDEDETTYNPYNPQEKY